MIVRPRSASRAASLIESVIATNRPARLPTCRREMRPPPGRLPSRETVPRRRTWGGSIPMRRTPPISGACIGSTVQTASRASMCQCMSVLPPELTGVKAPIVVLVGRSFPMIGAHKVLAAYACLVPRLVTGQFRPVAPAGDLAVDRKLLPRRRRDLAHSRLPRRRRSSGRHEPRAVRLAGAMGRRSVGHHPHARHRKQRQGNLRQVRRTRARQRQRHSQPVLRICELSDPLSLHGPRRSIASSNMLQSEPQQTTGSRRSCRQPARPARSRPATGSRKITAPKSSPSKPPNVRPCIATATASTTSRASATSTSR